MPYAAKRSVYKATGLQSARSRTSQSVWRPFGGLAINPVSSMAITPTVPTVAARRILCTLRSLTALQTSYQPQLGSRMARRGMTSVDWMVVVGAIGILLTTAVPGIFSMLEGQRVNTEASSLANDLHFARTEAVKRGLPVSVCVSLDGRRCAINATAWHSGWIVFLDHNGDQALNAGESVLRTQKPWTSTDTFTNHSTAAITYNKDGFAQNMSAVLMLKLQTVSVDAASLRCLVANRFGQQRVLTVGKGAYGKTCL